MAYRVYGSYKKGRFKAMDLASGVQVNNLIFATIFWDEQEEYAKKVVEHINQDNPDWQFELRKVG